VSVTVLEPIFVRLPDVTFVENALSVLPPTVVWAEAGVACTIARPATIASTTRAQVARRDDRRGRFGVCMERR